MKKLITKIKAGICLLVSLVLIYSSGKSQVDSAQLQLNSIFQHIDKSQIPTGFLEEYGAEFADLKTYNGILTDSNTVNAMAWHYIYAGVYSAKIYGTNTLRAPEANYTVFNSEALLNNNANPVSMLALNYSTLKPTAMVDNLFTMSNNQLYDVAGRTQSPYQLNTAFAASPFYETDADGVLNLIFKQNLFINTTGKQVSTIKVDFDNGNGFVYATWNSIVSASYTTTGSKQLVIRLSFTDGSFLQCYSKVNITNTSTGALNRYQPSTVTIPFNPTNNNHSGGDITVQYSVKNTTPTTNRKFQKPLIVVEAFDVHDGAPLLSQGYNYENFLKEITDVIFQSNGSSFNYNLDDLAGYDLIFLNYRDGTDDVLRNAALLEDVINWVNMNKATGAQLNVVMGISMGGLVSRYCLAKMTKENHNPQTRLLITHDSPHRGANVPLGAQYLINDFANKSIFGRKLQDWVPLLKQAVNLQLRPATLQQLIVRNNPGNSLLEYNTFLSPTGPYRQMVTFASTGPQPLYKFIATSEGSQCGVPVMQPSAVIAQSSASAKYSFILGAFGDRFFGEVTVNALPNGTASQRITYLLIKRKIKFLYINFTSTVLSFVHSSPAGILGYDGCPAGITSIPVGNVAPINKKGPWWISWLLYYSLNFSGLQLQPAFSFLPTVSALDEDNITATSLYAPHIGSSYVPPANNTTILQKYIAQEKTTDPVSGGQVYNIEHTYFTARNSNWIFNEMENVSPNNLNCASDCLGTNYSITGNPTICGSSLFSYNVTPVPTGLTVTWSVSPANIVTSPNPLTGSQTSISQINSGTVVLYATITNSCGGLATVSKIISVGTLPPGITILGIEPLQYGTQMDVQVNTTLPPPYLWYVNGSLVATANTTQTTINGGSNCNVTNTLKVTVSNSCGSNFATQTYQRPCTGSGFAVAPNPATNTVEVTVVEDEDAGAGGTSLKAASPGRTITEVRLYDNVGILKKTQKVNKLKRSTINLSALKTGVYVVEISDGNYKERHQLIIKK